MYKQLKGTGTALVTPFISNGTIDFEGLNRLIDYNIENGVDYLVTLGTTGESATLNKREQLEVLNFTIEKVAGRKPLVAGFGGNNTQALIDSIKEFHFDGIDAILSASPYYNKPTQEGIYQHYKAIAEIAPRPIILYNVPGRTASNITADTTLRLANDFDNIIAVKEASGDLRQCMQIIKNRPKNFLVISGDDLLTLPLLSIGADGVISVVANAFPKDFSEMVFLGLSGEFKRARNYHFKLIDIIELLFVESNPAGIKAALEIAGICESHVRLPLVSANASLKAALAKQMESYISVNFS